MIKPLNKRGETLTEALVSVLIISLSAVMLATMVSAAVDINAKANAAMASLYDELNAAETKSGAAPGDVFIDGASVANVEYYGGGGALTSYAKGAGGP